MQFLQRVLNAQIVITALAMLAATALRALELVPPDVWADVVNTALLAFVGGGFLKDGLTAMANKGSST